MTLALPEHSEARPADAFARRVLDVLNAGALALMTSIGHRSGLFDAMAALPPSTSQAIAEATGLDERSVREWLGAMVTGGFIDHDSHAGTYSLPPERAARLTRAAGPDNLAMRACYVSPLASLEDAVLESFRDGGGVSFSAYARLQERMAEGSAAVLDATLLGVTLPLVPGLVERLERGIDVLDAGCGRGHAVHLMARAFAKSRFRGLDFSCEAVQAARAGAASLGLANARFELQDLGQLCDIERYDLVTAFDVIHEQVAPAAVLRGLLAALRPGGRLLMAGAASAGAVHENRDQPLAPFLYTVSCMQAVPVSLARDGAGLGSMWGEQQTAEMLREAGFATVDSTRIGADWLNRYYVATKA